MSLDSVATLAAKAAAGDKTALEELLRSVWPDAYRIAWSILGERTAAEDAAQEACARVLGSLGSLREPESFAVWFYRIVVNEAKQRYRRTNREVTVGDDIGRDVGVASETRIDVRRAISSLDASLRLAIVLHYYIGLSSAEIRCGPATALASSSPNARARPASVR